MNILILTTRNTARSQMLEGWLRYYLKDQAVINSAGLEKATLDPFAIKAMMEAVIDIRLQKVKVLSDLEPLMYDHIFALTKEAADKAREKFPEVNVELLNIADPSKVEGDEMERLKIYRKTVDEIDDIAFNLRMKLTSQ